ncbi:hypothetical protein D3C79_728670 [compost metagenome]
MKNSQAGVQCATKVFALDARLVVFTHHRVEHFSVHAFAGLRLENICVADIDRVMGVQVVDQAGIAGQVTRDLVVAFTVFAVIEFIPVETAAENQRQWFSQAQAAAGINAVLCGGLGQAVRAGNVIRFGMTTGVPFEGVATRVDVVAPGLARAIVQLALADAQSQVMCLAEQLEGAAECQVVAFFLLLHGFCP